MKKLKLLLMAIIGFVAVGNLKVDAAVANGTGTSSTGLQYSIEKFEVYCWSTEGLKDMNTTPDNSKVWKADVSDQFTIAPTTKSYLMHNRATLDTVKLNVTGGVEKIKSVIKEKSEGFNISSGKNLCTLTVIYKITNIGEKHIVDQDYSNVFNLSQQPTDVTDRNSGDGLAQMVYSEVYNKDTGKHEGAGTADAQISYEKGTLTSRGDDIPIFDEYFIMPDANIYGDETYRFMMYEKPDLFTSDNFLQQLDDSEKPKKDTDDNNGNSNNNSSEDKTPTTPSNNNNNSNSKKNETITGVPNTDARNEYNFIWFISISAR